MSEISSAYLFAGEKQSLAVRFNLEFIFNEFLEVRDHRRPGRRYDDRLARVHHSHLDVHVAAGNGLRKSSCAAQTVGGADALTAYRWPAVDDCKTNRTNELP